MASHHHHFCHHPTLNPASCFCHCCYAAPTPCHYQHLPPPPPPPDSHVHHHPPQPRLYSAPPNLPNLPHYHEHFQERHFQDGRSNHPMPSVSSLVRRIAALEAALRRRSSQTDSSQSLRDAAARTIQIHFRAFLCRRSRTVRQLKDLASVKAKLGALKSSVSENAHFDLDVVYHQTVRLLLKLDTIQGDDPMIRSGKSSLSRELNKFLDLIDSICVERRRLSGRVKLSYVGDNLKSRVSNTDKQMGNVKRGSTRGVNLEKLRGLVERIDKLAEELDEEEGEVTIVKPNDLMIRKHGVSGNRNRGIVKHVGGVQPKVKKNVSFAGEDEKIYRVLRRHHEPVLEEYCDDSIDGEDSVVDGRELEDGLCREIEEIGVSSKEAGDDDDGDDGEEVHLEDEDGKESRSYPGMSGGNFARKRHDLNGTDDFIFRAPLPVKMETKGDSVDMRRKKMAQ